MPYSTHPTTPPPLSQALDQLRAEWRAAPAGPERAALERLAAKVHMLVLVLG